MATCSCQCEEEESEKKKRSRSVSTMTDPLEDSSPVLVIPHEDPGMRTNPAELHWRTQGPKWVGNLESAWSEKYPHLEDVVYCRYCGAVPCSLDHDEVNSSRIKDLDLVREIVMGKKELEQKYMKLEESMTKLIADSAGWQGERVMLKEEVKLAEKRKQEWKFEGEVMEAELRRLRSVTDRQLGKLADNRKDQKKIEELNQRLLTMEEENAKLTDECQKARLLLASQTGNADQTNKGFQQMTLALAASEDTIRLLKIKLDEANVQREDAKQKLESRELRMMRVEDEIKKLLKELEVKTRAFVEKDNSSQFLIAELRSEMLGLKSRLEGSELYRDDLESQVGAHLAEIEKLRNRLGTDKRFRMFVAIKRECRGLKEQNEVLLQDRKSTLGHAHSIPFLNGNGRVTSQTGLVRQGSPSLQRRRARSASAFTSHERLFSHRKIHDSLKLENL